MWVVSCHLCIMGDINDVKKLKRIVTYKNILSHGKSFLFLLLIIFKDFIMNIFRNKEKLFYNHTTNRN